MRIKIEPYKVEWKILFQSEKERLESSIKEVIDIEHVGSTAVQGLDAKPIIDIMIGLVDFNSADNHIGSITDLGYEYISEYETELPNRRFFIKEVDGIRTHHIHMVEKGTVWWVRHLKFRNHLIENSEDRCDYMMLKSELAEKEWDSQDDYANAKTEFIRGIENKILKR